MNLPHFTSEVHVIEEQDDSLTTSSNIGSNNNKKGGQLIPENVQYDNFSEMVSNQAPSNQ